MHMGLYIVCNDRYVQQRATSMAQDPLAHNSMTNDFNLLIIYVNRPRSQKTQLTQDMHILEETVSYTTHKKYTRKVSSMKLQIVGR